MIVFLIVVLLIALTIGWSLWKAPSDVDLWGEELNDQ